MKELTLEETTRPIELVSTLDAVLIVFSGASLGQHFRISDKPHLIGRSLEADIRLTEEGVSRKHASLRSKDGRLALRDLDSTNGTYVNGKPIEEHFLADGDLIQVGPIVLLKLVHQEHSEGELQQKLYKFAIRDGLTGTYIRPYFMEQVEKDLSFAKRHGVPLSLLILDVDGFARINDAHGATMGDAVLQSLGLALQSAVRKEDVLCRIGGDEFAVIMRDTAPAEASILAGRLRELAQNETFSYKEANTTLTVSVGIATYDPARHEDADALVQEAGSNLEQAKRGGHNQVWSGAPSDALRQPQAAWAVLVVDDEAAMRRALGRTLERAGFHAVVVESAARAIDMLANNPFDAVITDYELGDGDGLSVLREAARRQPATFRLLISGSPSLAVEELRAQSAFHEFLAKPFAPLQLVGVMCQAKDDAAGEPREPVS